MELFLEIDINIIFQGRDGKLIIIIILALEKYFIWPYLDKYL